MIFLGGGGRKKYLQICRSSLNILRAFRTGRQKNPNVRSIDSLTDITDSSLQKLSRAINDRMFWRTFIHRAAISQRWLDGRKQQKLLDKLIGGCSLKSPLLNGIHDIAVYGWKPVCQSITPRIAQFKRGSDCMVLL